MAISRAMLFVALALSLPTAAFAAMRDPGANHRQRHEQARILQGAKSGELTRAELRRLEMEQRAIRRQERAYRSDGKLTIEERRDLPGDLRAASRRIYEEKHDAERRN